MIVLHFRNRKRVCWNSSWNRDHRRRWADRQIADRNRKTVSDHFSVQWIVDWQSTIFLKQSYTLYPFQITVTGLWRERQGGGNGTRPTRESFQWERSCVFYWVEARCVLTTRLPPIATGKRQLRGTHFNSRPRHQTTTHGFQVIRLLYLKGVFIILVSVVDFADDELFLKDHTMNLASWQSNKCNHVLTKKRYILVSGVIYS